MIEDGYLVASGFSLVKSKWTSTNIKIIFFNILVALFFFFYILIHGIFFWLSLIDSKFFEYISLSLFMTPWGARTAFTDITHIKKIFNHMVVTARKQYNCIRDNLGQGNTIFGQINLSISDFDPVLFFWLFGPSSHQPIYDTTMKLFFLCGDQIFSRLPRVGFEPGTAWLAGCYANRWPNPTPMTTPCRYIWISNLVSQKSKY